MFRIYCGFCASKVDSTYTRFSAANVSHWDLLKFPGEESSACVCVCV